MTAIAESAPVERADVKTIVGGGVVLGILTAVGVVAFALLSRALSGTTEVLVQSLVIVTGGMVAAYYPSVQVRPRSVDSVAWAAMVGLLGALSFTVIDTMILRPMDLYYWRWDAIGGGSGWWYIPVWWMGAAVLAWLGGWVVANAATRGDEPVAKVGTQTAVMAVALFAVIVLIGITPFHAAGMALAVPLGLVLHVVVSGAMSRR